MGCTVAPAASLAAHCWTALLAERRKYQQEVNRFLQADGPQTLTWFYQVGGAGQAASSWLAADLASCLAASLCGFRC